MGGCPYSRPLSLRARSELIEDLHEADPEAAAKRYVKFGKFLLFRLTQRQLQDRLRDAQLKPQSSVEVADFEKKLADIAAELDRNFAEFRTPKGKWQESWSGKNIEELARDLAKATGGQAGQSDYYVFKLASLFTHNTPGSLFLELPADRETINWKDFRARIDEAGRTGARHFMHEAFMICRHCRHGWQVHRWIRARMV
jgi:hypothetical protein